MPRHEVSIDQHHAARHLELMGDGMRHQEAAAIVKSEFGLTQTVATISRTCYAMRHISEIIPDISPPLPPQLVVPYQNCAVIGDCHMPYIHKAALIDCLSSSQQRGIKTAILNGDALDMDWCSTWMSLAAPGTMAEVEHHRRAVYDIMLALAGVFEKIYVVRGNHDARLTKMLNKRLSLSAVWQMFAVPADDWRDREGNKLPNLLNIMEITERYYMTMEGSPTGPWRFSHQKNYSTIPGRVPGNLAGKKETNVVCAHTHHLAIVTSGTKSNWYGVEGGCLFDERKVEYKEMRDTTHPRSDVGWVTIVGGVPSVHHYERGGAR